MKKTHTPIITLSNVNKVYTVHHEKPTLMEEIFQREGKKRFSALKDVSLTIRPGEKIGIVGANGSGKTTLLKIIAGIAHPTSGEVSVVGKVVSLIDITAGFHSELSGYDNIFLNGLIIGMTKSELQSKLDSIITFADIGDFIRSPMHTYSDGMRLRLGIAIALHANPDILLVDEVIVTGDEAFRSKTLKEINKLVASNTTLVMVSHWLSFLEENCTRFIWIKQGNIMADGKKSVLQKYKNTQK